MEDERHEPGALGSGPDKAQGPGEEEVFEVPAAPLRPKCPVLWSGGLDSTWSLCMLLRHTDLDVHAHHVVMRSRTETAG